MSELHTQMDKHGRLLIPAQIRNQLNYKPGDVFLIKKAINDELHIISMHKAIKAAQSLIKHKRTKTTSLVDDFLKSRRDEDSRF